MWSSVDAVSHAECAWAHTVRHVDAAQGHLAREMLPESSPRHCRCGSRSSGTARRQPRTAAEEPPLSASVILAVSVDLYHGAAAEHRVVRRVVLLAVVGVVAVGVVGRDEERAGHGTRRSHALRRPPEGRKLYARRSMSRSTRAVRALA